MLLEAIQLYEEMAKFEKVGDLYIMMNEQQKAIDAYYEQVDKYEKANDFIKAALLCKNKIADLSTCQDLLLRGWTMNKDARKCLSMYFDHIEHIPDLQRALQQVYQEKVTPRNRESFLKVLHHEYVKQHELAPEIREMAYEVVAKHLPGHPDIAGELRNFNPEDKELGKDAMRWRWQVRGMDKLL